MNKTGKRILIMVITFVVIIAVFLFILPMLGVREMLGNAYIIVALIGSLIVSYGVSWGLQKLIK